MPQLQQQPQQFRKGDPVWWEPKDPIKARIAGAWATPGVRDGT
jgi:hypothetical protein